MASRRLHPPRSVRVRITLAAVLVTAVAVGTAGWLLVRSVEDAQVRDIRGDVNDYMDDVASRLEAGRRPPGGRDGRRRLSPDRRAAGDRRAGRSSSSFSPNSSTAGGGGDRPASDDTPGETS